MGYLRPEPARRGSPALEAIGSRLSANVPYNIGASIAVGVRPTKVVSDLREIKMCFGRLFACAAGLLVLTGGNAEAQDRCSQLWYERNSIFKEAGYCFRTPRAIRAFGNAGCSYDDESDVPLSVRRRQAVNEIRREERALGCPR
jgi:YARHG domain